MVNKRVFVLKRGNARVVIKKGGSRGKNYSIGLKDIDTFIISHMINIMKPKVKEANEIIKVLFYMVMKRDGNQ